MNLMLLCKLISRSSQRVITRASSGLPSTHWPLEPVEGSPGSPSTSRVIDVETVKHLERLSLVDFGNSRGIARLEEAIKFADQLDAVDTTGVEPLFSVLENEVLYLREDKVTEQTCTTDLLSTASCTEEDYYVAPPGNIPLVSRDPSELK